MSLFKTLLDFCGFVALLLWGAHMVQTGVQRAFGARLRAMLGSALGNRLYAFGAGVGVTAALQSSTATGLMTAGFAAAGLVELAPALAVMLGANVGTTLIVQAFSFDVAAVAPVLVLIGVVIFRRDSRSQFHDLGRVFIGVGLMLLALHHLLDAMTPIADMSGVRAALRVLSSNPVLLVCVGAGVAWAAHSSVAVVLLVMSLAAKGVVAPEAAFALALGANLGTAINPVTETVSGANNPAAKRLPFGNLFNRVIGVALALAAMPLISQAMSAIDPDPARAVANFHTLFNVTLAILFLPALDLYAASLRKLFPDQPDPADPARPLYLDHGAKETPFVALGGAAREALRIVDVLDEMLRGARGALIDGDRRSMVVTRRLDDVVDKLNLAVKTFVASLDPADMSDADKRRVDEILAFITNLEQAADVVDRNLLPHAAKRFKRGLAFSKADQDELTTMIDRLIANLRTAASLFVTEDQRAALKLAEEKVAFRAAEAAAREAHFTQLRQGKRDSAQSSALHLDLLRDIKLINSHVVAAAAYPVLERTGGLLESRIAASPAT
ncbi:Na/Pi cotransporter family protein [Terrarubrum flagellatum]|uniref:Na/Pi cotransporter family protein n=1 Tax=Terrirubrum flagellatum TaxID=2895980 RepID=UPI0031453906